MRMEWNEVEWRGWGLELGLGDWFRVTMENNFSGIRRGGCSRIESGFFLVGKPFF